MQGLQGLQGLELEVAAYIAVAVWCGLLCWHDVRTRRLPNWLTLGAAGVALAIRWGFGGQPAVLSGLAAGVVTGGLMLLPFLARGAGGGDVKACFAAGTVTGLSGVVDFLFVTCLSGCLVGLVMLLAGRLDGSRLRHIARTLFDWRYDRREGRKHLPPRESERLRVPFAVPLAIGLLAVCLRWFA